MQTVVHEPNDTLSEPDQSCQHTVAGEGDYEQRTASRDGSGKIYMGREISHVMGHLGAGWLERSGREREERTDLLIEHLPLRADSIVADIGAGTGYFSFPVAERVPEGRVLAVDIQPEMLAIIEDRKREQSVTNVQTVQGSIDDPGLAADSVDLIFIVDAYHEFSHPREMGERMFAALRSGGRIVLIEYRKEDPDDQRVSRVFVTAEGRNLKAAVEEQWSRLEKESFGDFSLEDRAMLRKLLQRAHERLAGNV